MEVHISPLMGMFLISFALGLAVRRWFMVLVSLAWTIPALGFGLGLWGGESDVPNAWVDTISVTIEVAVLGSVLGVAIGRMIKDGRFSLRPRR